MKHSFLFLLIFGLMNHSCNNLCENTEVAHLKKGFSYAEGDVQDFGDYAIYSNERVTDALTGALKDDSSRKGIALTRIEDCLAMESIIFSQIPISKINDTINLSYTGTSLEEKMPTVNLFFSHGDALTGSYLPLEGSESWLLMESINSDSTKLKGQFSLSFLKEPSRNSNLPDSIFYSNGEFEAEFSN